MRVSRDSAVLGIVAASALIGYLMADGRWPGDWTYQDWLKAVAAFIAWAMGRLQTSPLPGENDVKTLKGNYRGDR